MEQKESIKGVQVVRSEKDYAHYKNSKIKRYTYVLDNTELEKILMSDEIKDLPVAVVSVAGVQRSGKSFLLNYFLRYLSATPSARTDGSWFGLPDQQLTGFEWESDSERKTTGILIWNKPFVIQIPSGERVAVLLMETQGTFDDKSENSAIFALSALLSSTQIYNLKENINESDLMNLELFASYGALMKAHTGNSFQELIFLIRDREDDWDYLYGEDGGKSYMEKQFQMTEPEQLVEICKLIHDSFESVTCFLMPHPGKNVLKPAFKENPGKLEPEFVATLIKLVHAIFDSKSLCMKRLDGQPVRSRDLFDHFKTYVPMFKSDEFPEPTMILKALSEGALSMATNACVELFEKNVSRECELSMPAAELIELHNQQVELALASFESKRLFDDPQDVATKREEIRTELVKRLDDMLRTNNTKTNTVVTDSIAAYNAVILTSVQDRRSCEYASIMNQAHLEALIAALRVFDENRKIPSPDKILVDPDRQSLLKAQCKAGLLLVANAAREQFEYNVSRECALSMPEGELRELHDQQLELALAPFEGEHLFRDVTSTYEEIKTELTKRLDEMLEANNAKLMTAVASGIAAYDALMQTSAQDKQSYEYALTLKQAHEEALEAAMRVFDEHRKTLSSGTIDPDRQSFYQAHCKAGLLLVAKAARKQFKNNMSRECACSMPAEELQELHSQQLELALAPFEGTHLFGDQQEVSSKREEIKNNLANRLDEMLRSNNDRTTTNVTNAKAVYEKVIMKLLSQDDQPQEHVLNLMKAHETALVAATCVFDENRKKLAAGKKDPDRQKFLNALCEAGLSMVANAACEQSESNMRRECAQSMPAEEFLELQNQQLDLAVALFEGKHSFGDQQEITSKQQAVRMELTGRLVEMYSLNNAKTMTVISNGIAVYEAVIETLAKEQLLCLHILDLQQAHWEALSAATTVFDENRKKLAAGKTDPDREEFLEQCDAAHQNYAQINKCNNSLFSSNVFNEYQQYMMSRCSMFLSRREFREHHLRAMKKAVEEFESRRNRQNSYSEDVFKITLVENIKSDFQYLSKINAYKYADLLRALRTYYEKSLNVTELQNGCLHPDDLQQIHDDAVAKALQVYHPQRPASEGFSGDDPKEQTIKNLIDNYLDILDEINHFENERAKVAAFKAYRKKYDQLTSDIYTAEQREPLIFTSVVNNVHRDAFRVASDVFYEKRRSSSNVTTGNTHPMDRYFSALEESCLKYKQQQRYRNEQRYLLVQRYRNA